MSGQLFLLDKETREPVKENGAINFTVTDPERGSIELDNQYIMGVALNQIIVFSNDE